MDMAIEVSAIKVVFSKKQLKLTCSARSNFGNIWHDFRFVRSEFSSLSPFWLFVVFHRVDQWTNCTDTYAYDSILATPHSKYPS